MLYGFIVYIKTDDIYKDIAEDVEIRFEILIIGGSGSGKKNHYLI